MLLLRALVTRVLISAFFSLFLLTSCAVIDKSPYPANWPMVKSEAMDCSDISGLYHNGAELKTYPHPHHEILLGLTLMPPGAILNQVRSVSIDADNEARLVITAYGENGAVILEHKYLREDGFFRCKGSAVIVDPDKMPHSPRPPDNPLVGVSDALVMLQRAEDGSLIMREVGTVTGLVFLLFPMHVESEQWYLFRSIGGMK